jgi:hypothetical protein
MSMVLFQECMRLGTTPKIDATTTQIVKNVSLLLTTACLLLFPFTTQALLLLGDLESQATLLILPKSTRF